MANISLAHNIPRPMKLTTFIDNSTDKNKKISSRHGEFKFLLKDIINPHNSLLKNDNFSIKTTNDSIISYITK